MSKTEIINDLEFYENFAKQIDEEIIELKNLDSNENLDILEEVFMENLGFYSINSSFKDVEGGSVQTRHNIQNKIYSDDDMKYGREKIVDQDAMNKYKNKQTNSDGTIISEITGKNIQGNAHTDHIVSGKEYYNDYGFAQNENERKKTVNSEENFSVIEGSANQSKGDQNLKDWKENKQGGRKVTNKENFDYNDEIAKPVEEKDQKMRAKMEKERNKVLGKYYTKESLKKGISKGANMGLKIAITESIAVISKEIIAYSKSKSDKHTSLKDFLVIIIEGFGKGIKKLFKEIGNILKKMALMLANGLLETIITTIINIFFTTATGIIKAIRSIINIISELKTKMSKYKESSKLEKKKIMLSFLLKGVLTLPILSGLGVIQKIEEFFLTIGVPNIISDILAIGISNLIGGLALIIISKILNILNDEYNKKIARNIEILNDRLKTKISSIKAISAQIELKNSLETGSKFLEIIKIEEDKLITNMVNSFSSIDNTLENICNLNVLESLNLSTERLMVNSNSTNHSEILTKLKDIKF